jgi:hypothetical protein
MSLPAKPNVSYPPSIHRAHEVIAALSDAFDELRELYEYELADLKAKNSEDTDLFGLSPQETVALDKLARHDWVTVRMFMKAMVTKESVSDRPENLVRVVVYNLRRKLSRYGANILSRQCVGYSIQNLDLARENARKGIVVADYKPDTRKRPFNAPEERWVEAMQILRDSGPLIAREIAARMKTEWRVAENTKYLQLRLWLRKKETEGLVSSSYLVVNGSRAYVWQVCNTVA